MSGAAGVLTVTVLFTLCGLGLLALVGVATSPAELAHRSGLAPLAGMAWAGIAGATLATAGTRLSIPGLVALTALTCSAGAVALRTTRAPSSDAPRRRSSALERAAVISAVAIVVVVGAFAFAAFRVKPLAEYDGWAMWGMKARAIATLGSADTAVFASEAYSRLHIEYPLALPSLYALPLQASGFSSNTVVLQSFVVGVSGLLAIWALFRDRVRPALLLPFVAAIAAIPAFFLQLGSGYADVPLAVFVAGGLGAVARWLVDGRTGWIALAPIFFAVGALTKNEGLLFAAAAYIPLLLIATGRRRTVAVSALAVVLAYVPWRVYLTVHELSAPDYDLSTSLDIPWVMGRLDRAPLAAAWLLDKAVEPREFGLLFVLGVAGSLLTMKFGSRQLGLLAAGFTAISLTGITWIYVITPYDLPTYFATNATRVIVSVVVGLGALCPLLYEECARMSTDREGSSAGTGSLVDRESHRPSVLRRRSPP